MLAVRMLELSVENSVGLGIGMATQSAREVGLRQTSDRTCP